MATKEAEQLADALSRLTVEVLRDGALRQRMVSEPRAVLGERWIEVPHEVEIVVNTVSEPPPSEAEQASSAVPDDPAQALADAWQTTISSGRVELTVPEPAMGAVQAPEQELEQVAGGGAAFKDWNAGWAMFGSGVKQAWDGLDKATRLHIGRGV